MNYLKKTVVISIITLILGAIVGLYASHIPWLGAKLEVFAPAAPAPVEKPDGEGNAQAESAQLLAMACDALSALAADDYVALSKLVHPDYGVIFVPYSTIDLSSDRCFTPDQVAAFASDSTKYVWGLYDGSGEPISMTAPEYFESFVYNADYINASVIGLNAVVRSGNSLENVQSVFADGRFVDFYIPGSDPELEGIDWNSLKVVFEKYNGEYRLVALIHSQWTI